MSASEADGSERPPLGHPRLHLRLVDSTSERARALAVAGAPHGTLVSAAEQTAGRGRQGRAWVAPAGSALLCSVIVRDPPPLLSLIAGVAVCDVAGPGALLKWPNDVVVRGHKTLPGASATVPAGTEAEASVLRKLAGVLVEGRPQDAWAVLGIGLNVAVRLEQLPVELRLRAATLGLPPSAIEDKLGQMLGALEQRLDEPTESVLEAWRARDALYESEVCWEGGKGRAHGIDEQGRLLVALAGGSLAALDAGEVHLAI